ncbi:MAG: MORN repeat-containing protein [Gammaproteobacteria bacterium]
MNRKHALGTLMLLLSATVFCSSVSAQGNRPVQDVREVSRACIFGDCENGYGTLEMKTTLGTDTYRGNFKDGKYHGYGKLTEMVTLNNRAYYDGNWDEGVRVGRGTYYNGIDKLYIGFWKNDKREGRGSYFFGLTDWSENKYSEHWLSENVENYTGMFVNDLYQGRGTYRWSDGQKYVGEFFANDKHGPGTFIYPSGTIREQVWEYGKFVR